jgi:3-hydroxyacyl-[acyl-carrier-protein] dehydratase
MTAAALPVGIERIMRLLPHRYPFLLIDRVTELVPHRSIRAIKNVTVNEPFFQGHFPGKPVMPGVLVVEAMAQAGGMLTQLSLGDDEAASEKLFYLVKIDKARFSRMVVPGDVLELVVELRRQIRNMAIYACQALVDGQEVACAEILCAEAGD